MADFTITENLDFSNLIVNDLKGNINRWVHDGNRESLYGHFEQPIQDTSIIGSGSKVVVDNKKYTISYIIGDGSQPYSIILDNIANTGRVQAIYNIVDDENTISFPVVNLEQLYLNNVLDDNLFNLINSTNLLYGNGNRGDVSIANQINSYAYCTSSDIFKGSTSINLNTVSGFSIGAEIFIHQTQTTTDLLGNYEYNIIEDIIGNIIYLKYPLINDYKSGVFQSRPSHVTQVITVPNYNNVTINSGVNVYPKSWDGYSGGILIFKCLGNLINNGTIQANGRGFRGFSGNMYCGEGYYGYTAITESNYGNGGGCANNTMWHSGLEHGWTSGGKSGLHGKITESLSRFSLGGGSGVGRGTYCNGVFSAGAGANGGGCILIFAKNIQNNGSIISQGNNGAVGGRYSNGSTCAHNGSGGGGGAGGGILINCIELENSGSIQCYRGSGGGGRSSSADGQAGQNGYIKIEKCKLIGNNPTSYISLLNIPLKVPYSKEKMSFIINIDKIESLDRINNLIFNFDSSFDDIILQHLISFNMVDWYYYDFSENVWTALSKELVSQSLMITSDIPKLTFHEYQLHPNFNYNGFSILCYKDPFTAFGKTDMGKILNMTISYSYRNNYVYDISKTSLLNEVKNQDIKDYIL